MADRTTYPGDVNNGDVIFAGYLNGIQDYMDNQDDKVKREKWFTHQVEVAAAGAGTADTLTVTADSCYALDMKFDINKSSTGTGNVHFDVTAELDNNTTVTAYTFDLGNGNDEYWTRTNNFSVASGRNIKKVEIVAIVGAGGGELNIRTQKYTAGSPDIRWGGASESYIRHNYYE